MVSHGKSASKLERMKHIRRTHERFPYLMAALQMLASCIVQSFTKCRTKTSKNKSSTLIYQLCSVSPPVNFFAAHSGYDLSWATCWCWTCTVSCRWSWTMYCFAVYHYLLLRAYQANPSDIGIQSAQDLESWSRSRNSRKTSCSLAALITQATATAPLSCRNASCGFRIAEPLDWEIQRRLWGAFGICTAQLTFQKQDAWSCHHKSYKSARACKCNLHCCCLPTFLIHLAATASEGWGHIGLRSLPGGVVVGSEQ